LGYGGACESDRRFRVRLMGRIEADTFLCARSFGSKKLLLLQWPRILSVRLGASSTVPGPKGRTKTERACYSRHAGEAPGRPRGDTLRGYPPPRAGALPVRQPARRGMST